MKKLFVLSLMLAAAVNSYALSLIFKTPREIKQGESAIIGLSADSEKIKRFNLIDENFEKSFKRSKIFAFQPEIYIPAGSRHQGLSRFDLLPFTDRRRGDPDRYRAVNPNYVKKENGNYYFVLSVKPDTHYFDENLGDKGVLPAGSVEIDLTKTKTGDDKTRKYVYVKNRLTLNTVSDVGRNRHRATPSLTDDVLNKVDTVLTVKQKKPNSRRKLVCV